MMSCCSFYRIRWRPHRQAANYGTVNYTLFTNACSLFVYAN